MSSKLKLTTPWVEHLCIPIRNGANAHTLLDFNRFRYKGIPKTNLIKQGVSNYWHGMTLYSHCLLQLLAMKMSHLQQSIIFLMLQESILLSVTVRCQHLSPCLRARSSES